MDYYQSKDYISDYQGVAPSLHLASMRLSIYELDIAVTTFVLTFISFFLVSSWKVLPSSSYLDSVLVHMQSTITSWVFICSSHPEGYVGTTQFGPSSQNTLLSSVFLREKIIPQKRKVQNLEKVIKKLGGVICSISKSKESSLTKSMKGVSQHISKNWTDHYISIVLLYMY